LQSPNQGKIVVFPGSTHAPVSNVTQETNLGRLLKIAESQQRHMGPSIYIP